MTRSEAERYIRSCGETEGPDDDERLLITLFRALYDRNPDPCDWDVGVWSLCCAAVAPAPSG